MNNIGITGFARCGKDTLGKELAKLFNINTYALAQPIKDIMCALFGWDESHRDGAYKEIELLYSISPETIDQAGIVYANYGLDEYEAFHDCWEKLVKLFNIKIEDNDLAYCVISPRKAFQLFGTEWGRSISDTVWLDVAPKTDTVITDVRFDNEAEYLRNIGAPIVKITRDGFRPVSNGHSSEHGVTDTLVNFQILNNGTWEELMNKARRLYLVIKV